MPPDDFAPLGRANLEDAVTQQFAAARSHCSSCGAAMAPDQRYCVECGQRRGAVQAPFAAQPQRLLAQPRKPLSSRISPNTTLLAGVATLILAMGVGVLIGRSSGGGASRGTPYQVLTVPGATGATSTGTGTTGASEAEASEESGSGAAAKGSKALSKSKASKASGSSVKSEGSSKVQGAKGIAKPEKPVVTVGSKGKGRGYQKGKFTGNFFGGGGEEEKG